MAKRAILYARVSTHNQVDNTSLDYQIERCRQYAGEHGFQVVREIREQQSGAHANREGLNIAKEMGKLGLADCMIVYKMDRFMRGDDAQSDPGIDAAITERELNRTGLDVIFLDLPPRESEAYAWIKAIKRIVASVERESIRTRFENGKSAALAGGKPAHGGRCPLGYKRNDAGYFEIVETEASAIRLIYDLYLSGMNVPSIVDYLRRNNIPGYRNAKGTWGDWIVYEILKREAYYGRYAAVRNRSVQDGTRANGHRPEELPKDQWIYVDVPPIVTKEEWDKVQARNKQRVQKRKHVRVYYLLSGRVTCECGYKMAGNSAKRTRKDGSSVRTRYYRCKGKSNRYALKPCDTKGVPADKLEKIVYRWVEKVISEPDFIEQLYARTQKKRQQNEAPLRERLDATNAERLEAERRLRKLAKLSIGASDIELSVYRPEIEGLRNTVAYLTSIQEGIEAELQQAEADDRKLQGLLQYISNAQEAISYKRNDRAFREKAIRAIDLQVTVSLDQKTAKVSCVLGNDILSLYESRPDTSTEDDRNGNVLNSNASRTQYTDRTPAPRARRRAPAPNSPPPA